jgi:hypothetical protein
MALVTTLSVPMCQIVRKTDVCRSACEIRRPRSESLFVVVSWHSAPRVRHVIERVLVIGRCFSSPPRERHQLASAPAQRSRPLCVRPSEGVRPVDGASRHKEIRRYSVDPVRRCSVNPTSDDGKHKGRFLRALSNMTGECPRITCRTVRSPGIAPLYFWYSRAKLRTRSKASGHIQKETLVCAACLPI